MGDMGLIWGLLTNVALQEVSNLIRQALAD
jgi:hypothetical protein